MTFPNPQPLVWRGSLSGLQISVEDDNASIQGLPVEIINNYLGGIYQVRVYDETDKAIVGVLGAQLTGE